MKNLVLPKNYQVKCYFNYTSIDDEYYDYCDLVERYIQPGLKAVQKEINHLLENHIILEKGDRINSIDSENIWEVENVQLNILSKPLIEIMFSMPSK